ncbi:transposase [Xanthomonas cannabis]|uniref:IS5 family transposase n=2 Tax=Xanthomonas cannabis TaxID=1885674 RepID=A0ABR6JRF8_9XANT|nr:IS5 family transposase [Xanthomonas cannabis]MBB5524199.1 IS5 family transposase [Xanthomonas cannabis]
MHAPEMHQTKKGNQWYFGMKTPIGRDDFSGLVHHVHCTAANFADVTVTHDYCIAKKTACSATAAIPARTNAKNCRTAKQHSSSPPGPRRCKASATNASVLRNSVGNTSKPACAKVEQPFRMIKRQFGYTKVRYRGLAKNMAQVLTLFTLSTCG